MAKDNLPMLVKLCWLATLIMTIHSVTDRLFYTTHMIEEQIAKIMPEKTAAIIIDILVIACESLLFAMLAYGIFRFFIDSRDESSSFEYKRGITVPKTVFTLKWFFKITKQIWLIFAGFMIINMLLYLIRYAEPIIAMHVMEAPLANSNSDALRHIGHMRMAFYFFLFLAEEILYAALILIWPAIALSHINGKKISHYIKAVKGNILRLAMISIIIFAPVYIINWGSTALFYILMLIYDTKPIPHLVSSNIFNTTTILSDFAYLISFIIYCVFTGLLYKTLKDGGKI